ncbi:MAG: SMC-Scp complex subunit ScpB, partial [Candidatus Korarchaeota archaeon]|nr:SMC-Scp complex subunit ScpB [Candidatus Korarchaeota archaeon]
LALIAANEPVSLSEVVRVRGRNAKDHLRRLIQLGLIREVKEGRKRTYRTTKKFSLLFRLERSDKGGDKRAAGD